MRKLVKLKEISTREGVFETNSSSSHSLVFKPKDTFKKVFNDLDNNEAGRSDIKKDMFINLETFGWSRDSPVQTVEEKIAYILADQVFGYEEVPVGGFEDYKKEKNSEIIQWIEEGLNVELKINDDESDTWEGKYDAYVDHESSGTACDVVENKKTLLEFLLDDQAYIEIDNDNG